VSTQNGAKDGDRVRAAVALLDHALRGLRDADTLHGGLEEHVFAIFTHMYEKPEEGRRLVEPSRIYELRYEELVGVPVGEMRKLYEHLGLGRFAAVGRSWRSTWPRTATTARTATNCHRKSAPRSAAAGAT
jgi:hypothetical protein